MEGSGRESPWRAPPIRVHKVATSLWVDLHEVGDLLAHTNFLVQLHNMKKEAPKQHLINLEDTTIQKVIYVVTMMNSLLLCFKMIDSSTLNHSLTDLAW